MLLKTGICFQFKSMKQMYFLNKQLFDGEANPTKRAKYNSHMYSFQLPTMIHNCCNALRKPWPYTTVYGGLYF
jgi:hypothetical protein